MSPLAWCPGGPWLTIHTMLPMSAIIARPLATKESVLHGCFPAR
jgi:hypothetical protein